MSQQRPVTNQQQGLQRQQSGGVVRREVSGTLTRLTDNQETRSLTTWNAEEAVLWIEEAATKGHVVTPSMMPVFPHGRGVAVSIVRITDFDSQGTQLYPISGSGKLGLHKNVLDEIGRGYSIDWPPEWTKREPFTLPGSPVQDPRDQDPHCIKITVCGRYKKFDGTWSTLPSLTKEIDLREGSAEVEQIRAQHEAKKNPKAKADAEIAQLRKFIRAHAQTKARLQVIGTLVRRSYTMEELKKGPFYVFSSVWTGRSENPEIDMMLAKGALEMEKEGRALLYGGAAKQLPAVSEEPYQEDVEVLAYEEATKSTSEQVAEALPEAKQCTPDDCFGKGSSHVKACFGPPDAGTSRPSGQTSQPEAWVITDGAMFGKKITDPAVTKDHLSNLADVYVSFLENGDSPDDECERVKVKLGHVQAEIQRRGLTK